MGLAPMRASRERSLEVPLDAAAMHTIEGLAYDLGSAATEELLDEGVEHDDIAIETHLHLRYAGTDTALPVELSEPGIMRARLRGAAPAAVRVRLAREGDLRAAIEVEAVGGGDAASPLPGEAQTSPLPGGERSGRHAQHDGPVRRR